jgi:hypothetical protein
VTTSPLDVQVEPAHQQALDELTSIADRVRYACQNGPGPRTDEVRQWLAAYGYETKRPYVSTLVTGYRVSRGMDDTGDLPQLTEEVLADLDRARSDDAEPSTPISAVEFAAEIMAPDENEAAPAVTTQTAPVVTDPESVSTEDSNSALADLRTDEVAPAVTTTPAPITATVGTPAPADVAPVSTPPAPTAPIEAVKAPRRGPRAFTVAVFVLSGLAMAAGAVLAARTAWSTVLGWSGALQLTAGIAAVVTLVVFVWSGTATAAALAAGRTARDVALDVASWLVALIAGFLAAAGQIAFAHWAGINDWKAYLVPGILEPAVVVLLLLANRRVQKAVAGQPTKPIGKLLALAALLGGFAIYTNVVHAPGGSGLVFGAATTIGLILWWVKLQDTAGAELIEDAPHSKRISRRTARYRPMRWLILPAQTTRAWLISLDHSVDDAEIGLDLARRWRRDYDDFRALKNGRTLARRHASRQVEKHLAAIVAPRG